MTQQTIAPGPARITVTVETPDTEARTFQYDRCVGVTVDDGPDQVLVSFRRPGRPEAPVTAPIPRVTDRTEQLPPVPPAPAPWADVLKAQAPQPRRGRRTVGRHARP